MRKGFPLKLHRVLSGAVIATLAAISASARPAESVKILGPADKSATAHFNVYLPLTHRDALEKLLTEQTDFSSANYHRWLTPAQFKQKFGPSQADIATVRSVLEAAGMKIVAEETQNLVVEAPVSVVELAFSTHLQKVQVKNGQPKLAAENDRFTLPTALAAVGAVVPEFTTHLMAHVHSKRTARSIESAQPLVRLSSPPDNFFYPNDLNEAYSLPSFRTEIVPLQGRERLAQLAGVGAHIGIVISSVIDPADLDDTFNSNLDLGGGENLIQAYTANSNLPVPKVKIRPVDGGSGAFDPNSDDAFEASLDTQMSLGTAPGAKETLYNMPDLSDNSIADAYNAIDEDNVVDVVSSSFGGCELYYTAAYNGGTDYTQILQIFHSLFQQGNAQGITFLASSGDNGARPCLSEAFANNPTNGTSFVAGVESPANDPNVTAVGGTNLTTSATPGENDAKYETENANFDPEYPAEYQISPTQVVSVDKNTWGSGGGYSQVFAKPFYQDLVATGSSKHRAVPDVSMMMGGCPGDADLDLQDCLDLPRSAAIVWVSGTPELLIGTSASSPEMAGVLALAIEVNGGRLGNVNPLIYLLSAIQTVVGNTNAPKEFRFFHREISGDNNLYKVKPGQAYSTVLGNSTLDVKNFLGLSFAKAAGAPDTHSNP
jgi:subtilase family serine protease